MDSPGFSAKYCTYTALDYETKEIIDIEIEDKTKTDYKSGNMETAAFKRMMKNLTDAGLTVSEVVTDAHPQITAVMST
jgi:hypothetical protein